MMYNNVTKRIEKKKQQVFFKVQKNDSLNSITSETRIESFVYISQEKKDKQ